MGYTKKDINIGDKWVPIHDDRGYLIVTGFQENGEGFFIDYNWYGRDSLTTTIWSTDLETFLQYYKLDEEYDTVVKMVNRAYEKMRETF